MLSHMLERSVTYTWTLEGIIIMICIWEGSVVSNGVSDWELCRQV